MLNSIRDTTRSGRNPFPSHCVLVCITAAVLSGQVSPPIIYNTYKYHRNIKLGNQILYTIYIYIYSYKQYDQPRS